MKYLFLLGLVLLNIGCKRDPDEPTPTGFTAASCDYGAAQTYAGAVNACLPIPPSPPGCELTFSCPPNPPNTCGNERQDVGIQANLNRDRLNVYLCKNADCAVSVPSTECSGLLAPGTPCRTTTPTIHVSWVHGTVSFIGASDAGYTSYAIVEQICL